jgi:hypothetical protein
VKGDRPHISHRQAFCKGFQDGSQGTGPYPNLSSIDSEWVKGWQSYQEGYRKGQEFLDDGGWEDDYSTNEDEDEESYAQTAYEGQHRETYARDGDGALGTLIAGVIVVVAIAWSFISGSKE